MILGRHESLWFLQGLGRVAALWVAGGTDIFSQNFDEWLSFFHHFSSKKTNPLPVVDLLTAEDLARHKRHAEERHPASHVLGWACVKIFEVLELLQTSQRSPQPVFRREIHKLRLACLLIACTAMDYPIDVAWFFLRLKDHNESLRYPIPFPIEKFRRTTQMALSIAAGAALLLLLLHRNIHRQRKRRCTSPRPHAPCPKKRFDARLPSNCTRFRRSTP